MTNEVTVHIDITLVNDGKEIFKTNAASCFSDRTNLKLLEEIDNYYYKKMERKNYAKYYRRWKVSNKHI